MDYREAILSEEARIESTVFSTTDYNEFLAHLVASNKVENAAPNSSPAIENAYSVLSENTTQLFDMVNEIQHHYGFIGFCNNCDMYELAQIIATNMKLEELGVDDDEYIDSEYDDV